MDIIPTKKLLQRRLYFSADLLITTCLCYNTRQEVVFGLKELLAYEGNVEEDMGLTFQVWFLSFHNLGSDTLL